MHWLPSDDRDLVSEVRLDRMEYCHSAGVLGSITQESGNRLGFGAPGFEDDAAKPGEMAHVRDVCTFPDLLVMLVFGVEDCSEKRRGQKCHIVCSPFDTP